MEMEVDSQDFSTMFHSIGGFTLKDRQKNFFQLLNQTRRQSTPEQIESFLDNLHPRNYQEELFKIDALIYFHKTNKLMDIFNGGNIVFVSKVIKQPWFFQEVLKNINEDELVNNFLPNLSYSLRMKVLNRLSLFLNEAQVDKVFDCVLKRYGLFIASHILSACSAAKIEATLQTNEIKLYPNQVKSLFHKQPKCLILYLQQRQNYTRNRNKYVTEREDERLLSYIAKENPEVFWELQEKFKITTPLGRRTTKRLIDLKRDIIISNAAEYSRILKTSVMVRRLRNFPKIYQQIFPTYLHSIDGTHFYNYVKFLRSYPKARRWDIFSKTFEITQGKSIYENLTLIDESFITLFCDKEVQRKWAEAKYNKETDNNNFLKYFDTKISIPLLKEKINLTSEKSERNRLLKLLVICCGYNHDLVRLEEVLKYFCFRHRNEASNVRAGFLRVISYEVKLENLNENHWKYINELIELSRIRDEFSFGDYEDLMYQYLIFLYTNKKPTDEATKQFIKDVINCSRSSFRVHIKVDANIEKEILIKMLAFLPRNEDVDKTRNYVGNFINDVVEFNRSNPSNKIYLSDYTFFEEVCKSVFKQSAGFFWCLVKSLLMYNWDCPDKPIVAYDDETLLEVLLRYFDTGYKLHWSNTLDDTLAWIVCRPCRNELENKILHFYFNKVIRVHNIPKILKYFVNKEPQIIAQYLYNILENTKKGKSRFRKNKEIIKLQWIKKYSHLDMDKKTLTYYSDQVPNEKLFIDAFSMLSTTDEYLSLIEKKYLSKLDKLNLADKKEKELYWLQCQAVKGLKNVQEPYKAVTVVLTFCTGSYLRSSIPALYKIFYHTPEKSLVSHIEILSTRAVSVRKHALFLACELLMQEKAIHLFRVLLETEKNASNKKHLLLAALKYFRKNPSVEIFNLFISNMNSIDKNDTEFLESLIDLSKIPSNFKALYLEKTWRFFDTLEKENVNVNNYRKTLLKLFDKNIIPNIDSNFCKTIIETYFLKSVVEDIDICMYNFIYYFIVVHKEQQENFDFIFKIIREFKNENFVDEESARKLQVVFQFFSTFFNNLKNDKDAMLTLKFKQEWEQTFSIKESFKQIILLNLLNFYNESNQAYTEKLAKTIGDYVEQLLTKFGIHVTYLLVNPLTTFFKDNEEELNQIVLSMLKSKPSPEFYIFAQKINHRDCNSASNDVEDLLKQCEFNIVQMF